MERSCVLVLLALAMVLAFAAGCTSSAPGSNVMPQQTTQVAGPAATATETAQATAVATDVAIPPSASHTAPLRALVLEAADLPDGYSLIYEGEMLPGAEDCPEGEFCYLEGYSVSMVTGDAENSTLVDQTISRYSGHATEETLDAVLADQFPEIMAADIIALKAPPLGDASAAYRFRFPSTGDAVEGYLVIFGKGEVHEMIMVIGTGAGENLALDLAKKAASKIT